MAEHDHYMKFYPADYLADTGHLSTEEHGAYLLLIIAAFKRGGRLPQNQERLRRLAGGVDETRWPTVWASISEFFDVDGHELVQPRAKEEWERARDAVEKAKTAGKASGESRRRNKTPTGVEQVLNGCSNGSSSGDGTSVELGGQLKPNDPNLDPSVLSLSSLRGSESDQTRSNGSANLGPFRERPRVAAVGACTPAFLAVFDRYPRKDAKQDAAQVFQELAEDYPGGQDALSAAILAAFDAGMLKRHPYNGPNHTRPFLDKVLARRRWEDPESAPDGLVSGSEPRRRSTPLPVYVAEPRPKFIPPADPQVSEAADGARVG